MSGPWACLSPLCHTDKVESWQQSRLVSSKPGLSAPSFIGSPHWIKQTPDSLVFFGKFHCCMPNHERNTLQMFLVVYTLKKKELYTEFVPGGGRSQRTFTYRKVTEAKLKVATHMETNLALNSSWWGPAAGTQKPKSREAKTNRGFSVLGSLV